VSAGAEGRHASLDQGEEGAEGGGAVGEEAAGPARVRFFITARRVRIDPAERRVEYVRRLERLVEELDGVISGRGVDERVRLRAMGVLIRTISTCYGIVSDIELEGLEDELARLKEEDRRAEEEALGYTIEEGSAP
jgi:hypothetical protein